MSSSAGTSAVKRIQRELKEISESPSRHWTASPVADDLFEWQFVVRGPPATDFEGGIYTGRIVLPVNYPMAPPSISLLTPNGRWEVGKKICLSNSSYHPELWQPAWGIRTIMEALRTQFPMPGDGAIGALDWPSDLRKRLAIESLDFVCAPGSKPNRELLPVLSPDELREDQPEPVPPGLLATPPSRPAEPPVVDNEGLANPNLTQLGAEIASGSESNTQTPEGDPTAGQGLRQRHAPDGSTEVSAASSQPSRALSQTNVAGAPAPSDASTNRRRAANTGLQRRPQRPLVVQLVKPPGSRRGWVVFAINVLIGILTLSFLALLADMIANPPKLLDPLPEPGELKN